MKSENYDNNKDTNENIRGSQMNHGACDRNFGICDRKAVHATQYNDARDRNDGL